VYQIAQVAIEHGCVAHDRGGDRRNAQVYAGALGRVLILLTQPIEQELELDRHELGLRPTRA
jgi:hypothetical protein